MHDRLIMHYVTQALFLFSQFQVGTLFLSIIEREKQNDPFLSNTVNSFLHPVFRRDRFFHGFCLSEEVKKRKSRISEEKMARTSDLVLFIWVILRSEKLHMKNLIGNQAVKTEMGDQIDDLHQL